MAIAFYSPEFLLYPASFVALVVVTLLLAPKKPGLQMLALAGDIFIWVVLYIALTALMTWGVLPCVHILGHAIGGCY